MNLFMTFVLGLIMMAATSTSKIMVRDYKNITALILTTLETFLFVILISEKSIEFAVIYTLARLIGMAVSLYTFNKKREYIQSFNIVVSDIESYNNMTSSFKENDILYLSRDVSTRDLYNREVVVYSKSREKSRLIRDLIPKGSYIITSKTRNVELT